MTLARSAKPTEEVREAVNRLAQPLEYDGRTLLLFPGKFTEGKFDTAALEQQNGSYALFWIGDQYLTPETVPEIRAANDLAKQRQADIDLVSQAGRKARSWFSTPQEMSPYQNWWRNQSFFDADTYDKAFKDKPGVSFMRPGKNVGQGATILTGGLGVYQPAETKMQKLGA
jgi:hypothetical protein